MTNLNGIYPLPKKSGMINVAVLKLKKTLQRSTDYDVVVYRKATRAISLFIHGS